MPSSTLRHRNTANTNSPLIRSIDETRLDSDSDSDVIDLTGDVSPVASPDNAVISDSDPSQISDSEPPQLYTPIKTEPLVYNESLALVCAVSCVPYMLIMLYTLFPVITLILAAPWVPIIYQIKTRGTGFKSLGVKDIRNMSVVVYHYCKGHVLDMLSDA